MAFVFFELKNELKNEFSQTLYLTFLSEEPLPHLYADDGFVDTMERNVSNNDRNGNTSGKDACILRQYSPHADNNSNVIKGKKDIGEDVGIGCSLIKKK